MVLEIKSIFVAHAGAEKMSRQGYKFKRSRFWEHMVEVFNSEGKKYIVGLDRAADGRKPARKGYCTCPYHLENGICKHRIWASEQVDRENAETAALAEQAEGEKTAREEYLDTLEQGDRGER